MVLFDLEEHEIFLLALFLDGAERKRKIALHQRGYREDAKKLGLLLKPLREKFRRYQYVIQRERERWETGKIPRRI